MKNQIIYNGKSYGPDVIDSVEMHLAASLAMRQLEANTLSAVVKSTDTGLMNFTRNTPLQYLHRDRLRFLAYLQSVDREGPNLFRLSGTSAIGLLIERPHAGGIYTGQTAQTVIKSICGNLPVSIKSNLSGVKLYGWLPYVKPPKSSARDNLLRVLFALGATVKTDLLGTMRIEPLWDGLSGDVRWEKIYRRGAGIRYESAVSAVSVTEHQYSQGGEETTLFEGDALEGDVIVFPEPMYALSATGFSIQTSNANYAKLSAGSGTLKGRKYIHITREITETVRTGVPENVESVSDNMLISLVNSKGAAERLAAYYRCREAIQCGVVMDAQSPGDVLSVEHPYDRTAVPACLESLNISGSGLLKGELTALVGFTPPQMEQTITYDHHQVITSSGTVTLPDGVTSLRAVLIGGGNGGTAGKRGKDGTKSSPATSNGGTRPNGGLAGTGGPGAGGAGGGGSSGGSGGKIYTVQITGTIKTLTVSLGSGGTGGSSNESTGSSGGNTTLTVNGTTYSSASGSSNSAGYQDLVTGTIYAKPGTAGKSGAAGGSGGEGQTTDSEGQPIGVRGSSGSSAGSNSGGSGGAYYKTSSTNIISVTNGGGGGGGAYSASGSPGGEQGAGGAGASGTRPATPTVRGNGGDGGNGGGGGGGGGGTYVFVMYGYSTTNNGGAGGAGGDGGPGGNGAAGCVILYYGVEETKKEGGALRDKQGKLMLDRLGRILVI